jgi:hypothetical protein
VNGKQAKLLLHCCISRFCYIGKPAYVSMPKFLAGCHYNEEEISRHLKKRRRILAGPNCNGNKFATGQIVEKPGRSCEGADFSWLSSKVSRTLLVTTAGLPFRAGTLCLKSRREFHPAFLWTKLTISSDTSTPSPCYKQRCSIPSYKVAATLCCKPYGSCVMGLPHMSSVSNMLSYVGVIRFDFMFSTSH